MLYNTLEAESGAVADFYVKGFFQMVVDKIFSIAPDLHRNSTQPPASKPINTQ